ncbi:hypothetical protein PFISCL1PPCAC_23415, partial [Pristionchus fissidentatus]
FKMAAADVIDNSKQENGHSEAQTAILPKRHQLRQSWTYWYLNDNRAMNWEDRLKKICTFNTVEDFWALYNNIKTPSQLNVTCDYNVFKHGIDPMWEVPENAKGGRWLINIDKGRAEVMDVIWLEILIAIIGEQFGEDMDMICGLVANVRAKGSKISVWTRDHSNEAANMRIGNVIKQKLLSAPVADRLKPVFDVIRYEDHDSCQHKTSSSIKAKLSITAVDIAAP